MTVEMLTARHSDFHLFDYRLKEKKSFTEGKAENMKNKKVKFLEISIACLLCIKTVSTSFDSRRS